MLFVVVPPFEDCSAMGECGYDGASNPRCNSSQETLVFWFQFMLTCAHTACLVMDRCAHSPTVRFAGNHAVDNKPRYGVELDEPIGKNNGTIKGFTYFKCAAKHGGTSTSRITRLPLSSAPATDTQPTPTHPATAFGRARVCMRGVRAFLSVRFVRIQYMDA